MPTLINKLYFLVRKLGLGRVRLNVPGIGISSDDWRNDVHLAELGDGRNLLHYVVTEELALRHKGACVSRVDGDRSGRVDEVPGKVFSKRRHIPVGLKRRGQEFALQQSKFVAVHFVYFDARILQW